MFKISRLAVNGFETGCITDSRPTISFGLDADENGEELAYAVIEVNDWKIKTEDQINNIYQGTLKPYSRYEVRVCAYSKSGKAAEKSTEFRTGRLDITWEGKWITDMSYDFPDKVSPIPMNFMKEFNCKKELKQAWINCSALGVYEININGEKIGQDYFAPGFTSYLNQIQYQTYDITEQVKTKNYILAVVAGGWAAGSFNYIRKNKISADRQAFLCEVHLEYEDGSMQVISSDETWKTSLKGNYTMAEWYDGETYDATVDLKTIPWKKADITTPRKETKLIAQYGLPVRRHETLTPVSVKQAPKGEWIFDFGQNFAGVISAKIKGTKGQSIVFRHAEVLVDQELFVQSLRTAKATATYICKDGEQCYSPKLTYMGFRYVGVSGIDIDKIELTAYVLHSDFKTIGSFACSDEKLNQLQSNIVWGGKSNFVDIPTDCPQRDERQGWTGDIAVFASTASYNFDLSNFYDKWLVDMRSEQSTGGGYPMVIPRAGDHWPVMANSCWGDSSILVPWADYLSRGRVEILEKHYDSMKRFLKAAKWWSSLLSFSRTEQYIWKFPFHFGDWAAPEGNVMEWIKKGKWVGTAYFSNSCQIMSEIAKILGYEADQRYYQELSARINAAYRKSFTNGQGTLKKEFQTGYVLPLHFNMTRGTETKRMVQNLVRLIKEADNHLTTGFTGTPYILFALSDNGKLDDAYNLLFQDTCPSWLYEVKAGGTTIWERWDALRPDGTVNIEELSGNKKKEESSGGMVSFNHYANGAVGDWMYKRLLGLESTSGGYKTFKVEPCVGGGITWAKGHTETPYGTASVYWSIESDIFTIKVTVPVSTTCELILPSKKKVILNSGIHEFSE